MRRAYSEALLEYGAVNHDLVVLDADVSASTMTKLFAQRYPDRFFNLGIAEPGMLDVAVGLALGGLIPFANTFAALLALRACEQMRTCVAYAKTNVKLIGSYAGLSDFKDGPTHHSIIDLAVVRAMPNMTVMLAADAFEVRKMVPLIAEHAGPVYLRVSRAAVPGIFDDDHSIEIGRGIVLRTGSDVTIVGTGLMVARCLETAELLVHQGIQARVLEIHTLKPIDVDLLCQAAAETGAIVTVEEHSIVGGLGSAVAETVSACCPVPVIRVGVQDRFSRTALDIDSLLEHEGLGTGDVVKAALAALGMKG